MPERITDRATWAAFARSSGLGRDSELETEVEDMGDGDPMVVIIRNAPGAGRVDLTSVALSDLIEWSTAGH